MEIWKLIIQKNYYLEKDAFESVIEKNLKDYLKDRLYLQDNTVQLNDLIYYMKLGSGSYGNVSLVKSSKNKYFYAIKNISITSEFGIGKIYIG